MLKALNGKEGLAILEKEEIDLVLTDIEMPVMNGYEMVRRLREEKRLAGLPVIALSSLAGDEDVRKGLEAGVDRYLIKLDRTNLVETVWEFCEKGAKVNR